MKSGFVLSRVTPAHFLVANRKVGFCVSDDINEYDDVDFQPNRDSAARLIETWKKGQRHHLFWQFWKDLY